MENTLLNLIPSAYLPEVHLSQYDIGRTLTFKLMDGASEYTIPSGATIKVKATKPSGLGFEVACTYLDGTVTLVNTETMTKEDGRFPAELSIVSGGTVLGTSNFVFNIERSPHQQGTTDGDADTLIPELTLLVERAETASESVTEMKPMIDSIYPTESEHELYMDMVRTNLVSYLVRNSFSSCMVGTPQNLNDGYKVVYKYYIGKTYMGMYGAGTFDYDDTETVSGTTYKVAYFDCTTFASLITRGRAFEDSPYAYAFANAGATVDDMYSLGLEDPDPDKNYTFDALNNVKSDNFARIMNNSGNTIRALKKTDGRINEDIIENMETGDLAFIGNRTSYPSNYKGIHHCLVYVKTLEELNETASQYNVTFQTLDETTSDRGYVVEVWNRGSVAYQDKLVINTLDYWLDSANGTTINVFTCKGFANSQNSNKQYSLATGMYRLYDDIKFVDTTTYSDGRFPKSDLRLSLPLGFQFVGGRPYQLKNIDIDTMNTANYNGIWMPYSSTDLNSLSGTIPLSNTFFTLIVLGADTSGKSAKQIIIFTSKDMPSDNVIYIRQTGASANVYGAWKKISITSV